MMKKEKCLLFIFSLLGIGLFCWLCFSFDIFTKPHDTSAFIDISPSDAATAIEAKDKDMIIYCGQDVCSVCRAFTPLVAELAEEENLDIFYLDVDLISSQKELEKYQISETPTLIVINSGDVWVYRGSMSKNDLYKACNGDIIKLAITDGVNRIEYNALEALMEEPLDFILYIGRDDCQDCQKFAPLLEQYVADEAIGIFYLNIKEFRQQAITENASDESKEFYEDLKERFSISWVPLLIHFRNGIQVSRYEFLSKEYYDLEGQAQIDSENQSISDFYHWMSRETFGFENNQTVSYN